MKLKADFPHSDPHIWLKFKDDVTALIANEFALRLAAYAQDRGQAMPIEWGWRSIQQQTDMYNANVKQYPPNGNGYIAYPGTSWHNGRCAVDIDELDKWWEAYLLAGDMHRTVKQQELYKYGLCMPLNKVDDDSVFEWWHIQPVETLEVNIKDKTKWLDLDDKIYDPKEVPTMMNIINDSNKVNIIIDGVTISLLNDPIKIDGSINAPVRAIAEALGAKVDWDGQNVLITKGGAKSTVE